MNASNVPPHQHIGPSNFYLQADNLPGGDGSAEYTFPAKYFNNAYAPNLLPVLICWSLPIQVLSIRAVADSLCLY